MRVYSFLLLHVSVERKQFKEDQLELAGVTYTAKLTHTTQTSSCVV